MTQIKKLEFGQTVLLADDDTKIGEVLESDAWWDTIRLRGVAVEDQVLVGWEGGDGTTEYGSVTWEEIADLRT